MDIPRPSSAPSPSAVIAGRYRIEAELGRGGMACVHRVLDERTGTRLALKQLTAQGDRGASLRAMLEHEYHTLTQLAHPRIVRAFDYGLDGELAYYTMELLGGADVSRTLRETPLDVRQSCVLLRDAASAVALIHSRRMVHRDVSPRNVWCLPDGRAKLIDFGTLVAMGPQSRVAGTAPFVPPEALHMQPLDARCDIFALGALAYYMLTGRHAYSARSMAELRHVWQRAPKRPDALAPEVPTALADLVMAMLSLDARGRPASAAEVCERLGAAYELPATDERHDAQAFLSIPKLVARTHESGALRKRLLRATRGRGNAVAIVGPAGLGRSRMLASVLIDAKLLGAAAIGVDASAVGTGPFAVARAIAERLLETLPMTAAAAVELAPVLGHLSPALHQALGAPELAPLTPLDRALRLSSALVQLVEIVTRSQRVLIAVDDVHRADGASLGVLGRLSLVVSDHRLLLVISCDSAALALPPPALEQLCMTDQRLELGPLAAEHTRELLASLFGEIPGLDDAASWLHELSQGSPHTCMQYAQYLVDHGIARYEGGRWKLPRQLREQALPPTLSAMIEARLALLGDDARSLALALALARDETRASWQPAIHLRIEDYPKLIGADAQCAFRALDELLAAGFVEQRDSYYILAQRALTDALLRGSSAQVRQAAHSRLAEVLLQDHYRSGFLAVQHLQRAGDDARARKIIARAASRTVSGGAPNPYAWGAMRLSVITECTMRALAHYRTHGGSPREGVQLRRVLMAACTVYDWSSARFGDEQVAQLRRDSGLTYWDEVDAAQPPLVRMLQCFKRAQEVYDGTPEAERGFAPLDAVKELSAVSIGLSSAYLHMHDVARAAAMPPIVEPLKPLSPVVVLLATVCEQAVARVRGRDLGDTTLRTAQEIAQNAALPDILRTGLSVIQLHQHVVEDARLGRVRALELMDQLAASASDDLFYVVHGRWLAHAFRGDAKLAEPLRKQIEVITEDDLWRRKAFLFCEAQLHALAGDLTSLGRTTEAIAELAEKFEGWRPWLSWSRAETHRLRGNLAAAHEALEDALREARPGEHRAWIVAAPAHAELLLARGDAAAALLHADAIIAHVQDLSLDRSATVSAQRVRALAHSALHDHGAARASLARAFELAHELHYGGLPLARLYEANAAIALAARETKTCASALTQLVALLKSADAPALIRSCEALRDAAHRTLENAAIGASIPQTGEALTTSNETFTQVQASLTALDSREQRAQLALQLLLEAGGTPAGYLFLFDDGGPFVAAAIGRCDANETLLASVENYLQAELLETKTALVTSADVTTDAAARIGLLSDGDGQLVPVLLSDASSGQNQLAGLALLLLGEHPVREPERDLAHAVARCLLTNGDSLPRTSEDA